MYSVEIGNEYASHGTVLGALVAFYAFTVIYAREVVNNSDSSRLTRFFALFASNASVCAFLSDKSALFSVVTCYKHLLNVCHNVDKTSGTRLDARPHPTHFLVSTCAISL